MKWELFILLGLTLLIGLLNLLYYFVFKNSPDQKLSFLFPRLPQFLPNIKFSIENDLGRPVKYLKCTIFKGERVFKTFYPGRGGFSINLKEGVYSATISKFGFVSSSTDTFEVKDKKLDLNLVLKRTEEVAQANTLANIGLALLIINFCLFLLSLVALVRNYLSLDLPLQIILLTLFASSGYISLRYYLLTKFIRAFSFKGHTLKNEVVDIFGRNREPLKKITTSNNGTIKLLLSPGMYKFSPERYSPRTVRVFETGLGNFKIKF